MEIYTLYLNKKELGIYRTEQAAKEALKKLILREIAWRNITDEEFIAKVLKYADTQIAWKAFVNSKLNIAIRTRQTKD